MIHIQLIMKLYLTLLSPSWYNKTNYPRLSQDEKKVRSRWVIHQLTHKQRIKLCRENLVTFQNGSCRLYDIITGDKTRIYHRQIHYKSKNTSWLHKGQSPTVVVRPSKFEPKNFFSILFK